MNQAEYASDRVERVVKGESAQNAVYEYFSAVRYFLVNYPRRTIAVFMASLCLVLVEFVSAAMLMPLLSLVIGKGSDNFLIATIKKAFIAAGLDFDFRTAFLVFIAVFVCKIILELVLGIFKDYSNYILERDFRSKIINALKDVSWGYFTKKPQGLIVNLMSQEVSRAAGIFNMVQTVSVSFITVLAYGVLGVAVSVQMLIVTIVLGILGIAVSRPMFRMARRAGGLQIENLRDLSVNLLQGIQSFKVFKAMGRERQLLETLANANDHFLAASQLRSRAERYLEASQQLVLVGGVIGALLFGTELLGVSFAEVGYIAILLVRANANLANFLKKFQGISSMYYALEKYEEFLNEILKSAEVIKGKKTPNFPAVIQFENVTFSHENRTILQSVNIPIAPMGMTAIIGPSGSGKTTIIDLLCGFYAPISGRILIDGDDLSSLNLREWRNGIGYVTQETNLLHHSIAFNVAAFDPSISKSEITSALTSAGATSFVNKLDRGIQTSVGEQGGKLSGGERQRIAIARALARRPKLLILDEPTASVDAETESHLIATLTELKKSIPILVISHQATLAAAADTVYRIESGNVLRER